MSGWRPKFRADVHPHVLSPRLAVLDTRSGIELLEGSLAVALPAVLKGEPLEEIIDQLGTSLALHVRHELDQLRDRGLLDTDEADGDGVPSIVLVADYLDPELENVNREALDAERPWMLACPRGPVVWIGPVFVPRRGPCWACMAARLRAVRAAWQLPERRSDDAPVSRIGLDLAALEASRWRRGPGAPARLLTFNTHSLTQQMHVIARKPDCLACGDRPARRVFIPPVLQSRGKAFTFDGGHRAVPPDETWARYEHLISPLTGIVHHVEREYDDPGPLNVFVAQHNFTISIEPHPSRSHGKGVTAAQARTSALCEALERYCGVFHGDEPRLRAPFRDLGDDAVHPNACLGISERQYREREEWNRAVPPVLSIPAAFDEQLETDWVPSWSLTHERQRYVAAALCYYGYRDGANDFARADSNGAAAGTCLEDAVLQGLLELVERDAAGIWWYGRIRRPAVALETPFVQAMKHEYATRGRRLWLLDLTTDLGIPVCAAVSMGSEPESLHLGFGAHLDPVIAVNRAVSEANQLLAVPKKSRVYRSELTDWAFLEPHGSRELSTVLLPSDDLQTDVRGCIDILRQHGLEVIVVDQTRAEAGLPVVKVVIPGLRHFRPRFAPGRLYDVPVRLGWVDHLLCEEELNPSHMTT